uniref:Uncharacterized protein n=1 Tax=Cannabis sativa TaxID=3483 RepID=A0A803QEA2_CANSA
MGQVIILLASNMLGDTLKNSVNGLLIDAFGSEEIRIELNKGVSNISEAGDRRIVIQDMVGTTAKSELEALTRFSVLLTEEPTWQGLMERFLETLGNIGALSLDEEVTTMGTLIGLEGMGQGCGRKSGRDISKCGIGNALDEELINSLLKALARDIREIWLFLKRD